MLWISKCFSFFLFEKNDVTFYRLVTKIMNVTATMAMPIPATMLVVSASPNISVPTNMAVMGSNTPNTEALVAPILRVATAKVAVDTMVGSKASPIKLSQSLQSVIPVVIGISEKAILAIKMVAPTESA